jgi:hypothetical protein
MENHIILKIYKIENHNMEIQFVAGEFSNCVWGFINFTLV